MQNNSKLSWTFCFSAKIICLSNINKNPIDLTLWNVLRKYVNWRCLLFRWCHGFKEKKEAMSIESFKWVSFVCAPPFNIDLAVFFPFSPSTFLLRSSQSEALYYYLNLLSLFCCSYFLLSFYYSLGKSVFMDDLQVAFGYYTFDFVAW